MRFASRTGICVLSLAVAGAIGIGCSGAPPPEPPAPKPAPPPPPPPPEPEEMAEPEEPEEPVEPVAEEPQPKKLGPAMSYFGEKKVNNTFGSAASRLELGGPTGPIFYIPQGAFVEQVNVTFAIEPTGKKTKGATGNVYSVLAQIPPSAEAASIESNADPFVFMMPTEEGKSLNLAIGEVEGAQVKWRIIAPSSVDEAKKRAHFEVPKIQKLFVHLTTAEPTS